MIGPRTLSEEFTPQIILWNSSDGIQWELKEKPLNSDRIRGIPTNFFNWCLLPIAFVRNGHFKKILCEFLGQRPTMGSHCTSLAAV